MSFENVVQNKLFIALDGIVSVPVYDVAPQDSNFPYITIGEASLSDNDTETTINNLVVYTINVWSRAYGFKETKQIQGEVKSILHLTKFSEAGYSFTENYFQSSQAFTDQDGITRHGIQNFKLTIQEA